jgi:hypothetical protein
MVRTAGKGIGMRANEMITMMLVSWMLAAGCGVETLHSIFEPCDPFSRALSENDDQQRRPLEDALEKCFACAEFDIWYQDGELRVGPDRTELEAGRTLETVYLEPLLEKVWRQGGDGCLLPDCHPFTLVVDIRSEPTTTWEALQWTLMPYEHLFSGNFRVTYSASEGWSRPPDGDGMPGYGPLSLVVAGRWPRTMRGRDVYFQLDARLDDLPRFKDDLWVVQISEDWTRQFSWNGRGTMPELEQNRLASIVELIHREGRTARFAGTPDRKAVWQELLAAGVDVIGTQDLEALERFLLKKRAEQEEEE